MNLRARAHALDECSEFDPCHIMFPHEPQVLLSTTGSAPVHTNIMTKINFTKMSGKITLSK